MDQTQQTQQPVIEKPEGPTNPIQTPPTQPEDTTSTVPTNSTPTISTADEKTTSTSSTTSMQSGAATPPLTPPVQSKKGGSYISGKTTALILVLAAVALFFLFLAITPQTPKTSSTETAKVTTAPMNETELALESVSTTSSASKNATVNVTVNSHTNAINVIQLELAFDPTVISNVTLTPGTFLKNPIELTKDVDLQNGRISYALGIAPSDSAVKGQGVFATLTIAFQPTATAASTTISFLPKTLVGAAGMNGSALKSAKSLQLSVPTSKTGATTVVPLHTASPSSGMNK